jgi:uncharacterized membrane protein YphA (DoxX/SURF4 family)
LRSVIGIVTVMGAGGDLLTRPGSGSESGWMSYIPASIALIGGILLIIGLATPVAASIAALLAAGVLFSIVCADQANSYASKLCGLVVAVSSASLVLLGPGAFSLDARLFGWREIILPPRPSDGRTNGPDGESV